MVPKKETMKIGGYFMSWICSLVRLKKANQQEVFNYIKPQSIQNLYHNFPVHFETIFCSISIISILVFFGVISGKGYHVIKISFPNKIVATKKNPQRMDSKGITNLQGHITNLQGHIFLRIAGVPYSLPYVKHLDVMSQMNQTTTCSCFVETLMWNWVQTLKLRVIWGI